MSGILRPQPVSDILRIDDDEQFAIAIGVLVSARARSGGYRGLSVPERVIYCVDQLEGQVNSDGFDGFFRNFEGDPQDAYDALLTLGAPKTAALVARAIAVFPGGRPDPDRNRRIGELDKIGQSVDSTFRELENTFYHTVLDNLDSLERAYVRSHRDAFHSPR